MALPIAKIDVDPVHRKKASVSFWSRVNVRGPDDCWLWEGRFQPNSEYGGHGMVLDGRWHTVTASRFSCWLNHGPPVAMGHGQHSRHLCHNKACVNPRHVVWGTARENQIDNLVVKKGAWYRGIMRRVRRDRAMMAASAMRAPVTYAQSIPTRAMAGWSIVTPPSGARLRAPSDRVDALAARAKELGVQGERCSRRDRHLGPSPCSLFNDAPAPAPVETKKPTPFNFVRPMAWPTKRLKRHGIVFLRRLEPRHAFFVTHTGQMSL